jgi:hypothetical protein
MGVEEAFPNTQEGRNWTVAVFKAPEEWVETLRRFFSLLKGHKECLIPHYTVRASPTGSIFISLRVLRRQQDEDFVKSKIAEFLRGYEYEIDPREGDRLFEYYAWIAKDKTVDQWTKERCVTLNKMSKFALEVIDSKTEEGERLRWGHLFSNMMAIFDLVSLYQSPENPRVKSSYYFDTRNYPLREHIAEYLKSLMRDLLP